ncbi:Beta-hexosaminidase [Anaerohalosphaera lusitana]|uniref:beta-N-acetylhexosaminidase n=1 Tax=Anaerohalosphaera lusitana TaxID=1936003 RepID=A0A1U9NJN9_9BACT|nr:beta-N-acetylhexosaminidase [Anaerohalosphaera lusitana]AQT68139.1 Beta-hexosaminidase [Anaerohalosphaera lusitana]
MYRIRNLILTLLILCTAAPLIAADINIIPKPQMLKERPGSFTLTPDTQLVVPGPGKPAAQYLAAAIEPAAGCDLTITDKQTPGKPAIIFTTCAEVTTHGPEGYHLLVTEDKITITADAPAGFFYAVQTLRQLLPPQIESDTKITGTDWTIPAVLIHDQPRFGWRGFMLDESRHFFGKEQVKKLLDRMAFHKLNRFHWHLTDEQGWRIEIKKYPKLTTIGGIGNATNPDAPARFYTQEDIREIVAYAAKRHIMIIPEIDMPGHAKAAVTAYPEHAGGPSTFNPASEATYAFLEDIITEVADLFPAPYLHLGADEVRYWIKHWNDNEDVKKLMADKNFKNVHQVELYFIERMIGVINSKGKTAIGWDEIVDANITPQEAVVMWWRHNKSNQLKKAIEQNFKVVMCPRNPTYWDYAQAKGHPNTGWGIVNNHTNMIPFPDFPEKWTDEQKDLVLGIQANLWTEHVESVKRYEFQIFPRMASLAESAWTDPEQKSVENFESRLKPFLDRYEQWDIYYYNPFKPDSTPCPPWPKKK